MLPQERPRPTLYRRSGVPLRNRTTPIVVYKWQDGVLPKRTLVAMSRTMRDVRLEPSLLPEGLFRVGANVRLLALRELHRRATRSGKTVDEWLGDFLDHFFANSVKLRRANIYKRKRK